MAKATCNLTRHQGMLREGIFLGDYFRVSLEICLPPSSPPCPRYPLRIPVRPNCSARPLFCSPVPLPPSFPVPLLLCPPALLPPRPSPSASLQLFASPVFLLLIFLCFFSYPYGWTSFGPSFCWNWLRFALFCTPEQTVNQL